MTYIIQANIYIAVLAICYQLGFRKHYHFSFGRSFLIFGVLLSLLLPMLEVDALSLSSTNQLSYTHILETFTIDGTETLSKSDLPWINEILYILYTVIVCFFLLKIVYAILHIIFLKYGSEKKGAYYELAGSSSAFSFFNLIFIGAEIPLASRDILYKHEQVHFKCFHSIDILLIQFIQAFFWFNPFIYRIKRLISELHEFEADQKSVENKSEYIELLIKQQFQSLNLSIVHQFNSNYLKNRIMRIKHNQISSFDFKLVIVTSLVFFALFTINQNIHSQNIAAQEVEPYSILLRSGLPPLPGNKQVVLYESCEADKLAQFPGGSDSFGKFIQEHVKYPKEAKKNNISGTVYVQFLVDIDGTCKNAKIIKGVNRELDEAAIRVIGKMPKWNPAEKEGKKVASTLTLPIRYKLPENKE